MTLSECRFFDELRYVVGLANLEVSIGKIVMK